MQEINDYLASLGLKIREGSSTEEELQYLSELTKQIKPKIIGEVGFNAGYSSYIFLQSYPNSRVVSFDIGEWDYVQSAKDFIDKKFPGRHTLIIGDSRNTIPEYSKNNPGTTFDIVFIDGGHTYDVAKADLLNMQILSNSQTSLVMDDIIPWREFGKGPTRAWTEMIGDGLVIQKELMRDGIKIDAIQPPGKRIWALGYYT